MKARFFAIAALVLGLASCQKDFAPEANLGAEVDYRLEVSATELGVTRAGDTAENPQAAKDSAFGAIDYFQGADWSKVDLRYTLEIYDANEDGSLKSTTPVKDRQAIVVDEYTAVTFETRLAPKRNYRFVVFADFVENGAATAWSEADKLTKDGLNHRIGTTLANIELINEDINDEASDAYFAFKKVVPGNNTHNTDAITLSRPYGKLRVVATDLHELNLNVKPGSVKVVYNGFNANTFNAVEGTIAGEYETNEFDYDYVKEGIVYTEGKDALKGEKDRNTHMTIFTDYILAEDKQHTINFNMIVNDTDGVEIKATAFSTEIPVQRNHLTTIIGNVLTTATEVEVTINDNFFGELTKELKIAYNAKTLQQYIDEANPGDTIYVGEGCNCEGIFLINKDINIEGWGANATITGKVGIIAGSDNTNFKNIKFVVNDETEKGAPNGQTNKNGIVVIYASAVGFENCVFEGMTEAVYAIYNKDNNAQERVTVKNCEFYGNRAIRTRANVVVDGCTFEGNTKPIVDVLGFGATDAEGYVQFTNNYSTANVAGVMLKVGNHEFRHVVFNVGENSEAAINSIWRDEAFNHKNLANFTREFTNEVKTINYAETEDYVVATAQELQLLLDNDELNEIQVEITAPINYVGEAIEVNRDATIDFKGNALNAGSTASSMNYALEINGCDVKIYNANFTRAGIAADHGANVTFYSSKINHKPERTSRYIFTAHNGSIITVEGGTFTNDRAKNSYFWADTNAQIIVKGGTFNGVASNKKVVESAGGKVIIYGGTFNFDPTAYVAEGYIAKKSGSNWVVKLDAVEDAAQLADALANAAEGDKINLMDGVNYGVITAGELKNVTINGAENSVVNFITDANTVIENVTLNGVDFVYDGSNINSGVVINADAKIENLVLDGCSFVGTGEKKGRGIYGQNSAATITLKNCNFKDLGYPVYTMAAGGYASLVVEGCTFENIKSWAIMPQYNDYLGDLTVNNCNFVNCVGGLVKAGKFTAGHTFTFTNNVITNSAEHPAKNWFTINTADAAKVVENNTKDGAAWTPGATEGLN